MMNEAQEPAQALQADDYAYLLKECDRLQRQNELLREQMRALLVLQSIANSLNAELDLPRLLRQVAEAALRLAVCSASALLILDPTTESLVVEALERTGASQPGQASGISLLASFAASPNTLLPGRAQRQPPGESAIGASQPAQARKTLMLGEGVAGWVAGNAVAVIVNQVGSDSRFSPDQISVDAEMLGVKPIALACVPLVFKGRVIGVLETAHTANQDGFDARDLDLLRTLAAQAATAVANSRLYQELRAERDQVITMQEDLRKRLARDLHDGPAQVLASVAMRLDFARKLLIHEPDKVDEELRGIGEQVTRVTREVRDMLFDLRPLVLEAEGLAVALERFLERFKSLGGPKMHLLGEYRQRLPYLTETTVFSITQEAVNNVLKHARARNCWIEIQEEPQALRVIVRDDGVGFDVQAVRQNYAQRGSWGLLNMRERAALVDGILTFQSQPGGGSIISLTVPQ
ncbi:MAG TPA: GAF domain-containing sensor histidine kinase [Ktedonobacterales bacterium]|nr:GAF domain-containing sensor histidine kinase [Ktedonobacterales bacterium]